MNRRIIILAALLGVLLVLAAALSWGYMARQRELARAATVDLAEGRKIMDQIEAFRRRPTMAADRKRLEGETHSLIESAAQTVGINLTSVRRFSDETPRRLGDSVYKEVPTQVLLQPVTLKQMVDLAIAVSKEEIGLNVDTIRLSVPRESQDNSSWTAEVVLTYLVYDPPQAGKQP